MTAVHDLDYVSTSKNPYVRYVHQEGAGYTEWKLEPLMVTGGHPMKSGKLGGFAIMGGKGDGYNSSKYQRRAKYSPIGETGVRVPCDVASINHSIPRSKACRESDS